MGRWLRSVDGYALITKIEDEKEEYIRHLCDMADITRPASVNGMVRESKVKLPVDPYDQLVVLNDQSEYVPTPKLLALATAINHIQTKANNSHRLAHDVQKVLNLSPKASPTSSTPSSSDTSVRSIVFDAAGALLTTFANTEDEVKDMVIERKVELMTPNKRETYKFRKSLFVLNGNYSSLDDSNPEDKVETDDLIDRASIESLEPWMKELAGSLENERCGKTVTLYRTTSTARLQPQDS